MNYLTDEDNSSLRSQDDEINQIKSIMRIAHGRKTAYNKHIQSKIEKHRPVDNEELKVILKKQTIELNKTKSRLSECELELKESKFEIFQLQEKEKKIWEEKKIIEFKSNEIINHLKAKIEQRSKNQDNKDQIALLECRKLMKAFNTLEKATNIDNNCVTGVSRITKNLFEKAIMDIVRLSDIINNKATTEIANNIALKSSIYSKPLTNVDVSCENAMLDICRSLEEENRSLSDSIDHLRIQLVDANKEASINKLIPHYRLAIVRSRNYAANLFEQLNREKEISNTLRSQLELTYTDLKRVAEEKRQLYTDTSTPSLQADEQAFLLATTTNQFAPLCNPTTTSTASAVNIGIQSSSTATFNKDASTNTTTDIIDQTPKVTTATTTTTTTTNHSDINVELKNRISISNKLSQSIENENLMNYLDTNSSQLKSELGILDNEIEQLKIKLRQAAMMKSKKIINEVIGSQQQQLTNYIL